jgi:hypothetical protein
MAHKQNGNRFKSNMQSSQTHRAPTPVLWSVSGCSQTPLELTTVLPDAARAFSGAAEITCNSGGVFWMLCNFTSKIINFWSSWEPCTDLREISREVESAAQLCRILPEQPWLLCSFTGNLTSYSHHTISVMTPRHCILIIYVMGTVTWVVTS